jgi:hypothetical protein
MYTAPLCVTATPPAPPPTHTQRAKEDASHTGKKAAINVETAADSAKHEAKGFGARLWGKGQVGTHWGWAGTSSSTLLLLHWLAAVLLTKRAVRYS